MYAADDGRGQGRGGRNRNRNREVNLDVEDLQFIHSIA